MLPRSYPVIPEKGNNRNGSHTLILSATTTTTVQFHRIASQKYWDKSGGMTKDPNSDTLGDAVQTNF